MRVALYLWQLPQNLLALLVKKFLKAEKRGTDYYLFLSRTFSSVSLGDYIFINFNQQTMNTINHEKGHQKQSRYLGWLYLIVIGIPSVCGNLWNRWFHKDWTVMQKQLWYYELPWEKSADLLGYVKR